MPSSGDDRSGSFRSAWSPGLFGCWQHRRVLFFIISRDITVRYKQTYISFLWILVQPAVEMAVMTLIFGTVINVGSEGMPYPVFVYVGIITWAYFSATVAIGTDSLVATQDLIRLMAFPRLLIPLAKCCGKFVDFCAGCLVLVVLLLLYQIPVTINILWVPLLAVLLVLLSFGLTLWLSALHVLYRDIGLTIPYVLRIGMFLTPVMYSSELIPAKWSWALYGNPLVGIIDGFRAALFAHKAVSLPILGASTVIIFSILISGFIFFSRMERHVVDAL